MRAAIPVVLIVGTGVAYAQAPGATPPADDMEPAPVAAPAPAATPAPTPAPVAKPAVRDVLADRWAVNLSLFVGAANPRVDNAKDASVGGLELSGRYRIRSDIELALELQAGGGNNNEVSMGGLWADFRYRFLSERDWNWIGVAGLGVVSVAGKDPTDEEKKGRGAFRIGAGVERRFGAFAIEADLRFSMIDGHGTVPVTVPPTAANQLAHYNVTGGALVIGANYYF